MAATRTKSESRIEIVAERRRKHDETFRAEMVALSMAPGASVQALAREHGLAPSLIDRWRRLRRGKLLLRAAESAGCF